MSKFKNGDIVRYSDGSTALMMVDFDNTRAYVSPTHGMRYYGKQYYGGACGAYEVNMSPATEKEIEKWNKDHDENGKFIGKFND